MCACGETATVRRAGDAPAADQLSLDSTDPIDSIDDAISRDGLEPAERLSTSGGTPIDPGGVPPTDPADPAGPGETPPTTEPEERGLVGPPGVDLSDGVLASSFGFDAANATEALVAALRSPDPIIIVDDTGADWLIDPIKVFDVTDKVVVFEPGVVVRARPGAFSASNAILLNFSRPVNLGLYGNGATLTMNKSEYTTGEGRHAIALGTATNVRIQDFVVSNSGGDGLYISGSAPPSRTYSQDVFVDNVVFDNHRRQAMSIISAQNVFVTDSTFSNTIGTLPEAGVDLEPNQPYQRLVNIDFDRSRFVNNGHAGFVVAAGNLDASSLPISVEVTNSYFSMNHRPGNAYSAAETLFGADRVSPVGGSVVFDGVEFDGSEWPVMTSRRPGEAYSVTMRNIVARDTTQTSGLGLFTLEVPSYEEDASLGNHHFENVTASYDRNLPVLYVYNWPTLTGLDNVTGSVDLRNEANPPAIEFRRPDDLPPSEQRHPDGEPHLVTFRSVGHRRRSGRR